MISFEYNMYVLKQFVYGVIQFNKMHYWREIHRFTNFLKQWNKYNEWEGRWFSKIIEKPQLGQPDFLFFLSSHFLR